VPTIQGNDDILKPHYAQFSVHRYWPQEDYG